MLKDVLELYAAAMAHDVRTPMPHLVGPPGSGKSTVVEKAAAMLSTPGKPVRLHTVNVSRISPLELEGVQMPVEGKLKLLLNTTWESLQEGDIVLWDEFLRGFPEVYNGLLDIFSSRQVAGYKLPKVFFIGASNSNIAYDAALSDRLLNIKTPDPRTDKGELTRIVNELINAIGLYDCTEVRDAAEQLIRSAVFPMYTIFDKTSSIASVQAIEGSSPRNLIGQAQLRYIQNQDLGHLLSTNNRSAAKDGKHQFIVGYNYGNSPLHRWNFLDDWVDPTQQILDTAADKLSENQIKNMLLNLDLHRTNQVLKEALNA